MTTTPLLRELVALLWDLPDRFVRWADRVALAPHQPEDAWGDQLSPWCLRCQVPWPCDEFVRLSKGAAND
jgi:hypothetical protein